MCVIRIGVSVSPPPRPPPKPQRPPPPPVCRDDHARLRTGRGG